MATRWEDYRTRRRIDIAKWATYLRIHTYEGMCAYLSKVGVIPPEEDHQDVSHLLSLTSGADGKDKPMSGRKLKEESVKDANIRESKSKPTSGRSSKNKSTNRSENPPSTEKKRRPKRRSTARKSPAAAKKTSVKKRSE
jgi:hypothetical protein